MSTTEHTPGPWNIVPAEGSMAGNWHIVAKDNILEHTTTALATVWNSFTLDKSNAHIVAAAPDMLEALEELAEAADYSQLRGIPDREASDLRVKRAIAAAQAVCTKAKGGAA